jgi:hypothetical protein
MISLGFARDSPALSSPDGTCDGARGWRRGGAALAGAHAEAVQHPPPYPHHSNRSPIPSTSHHRCLPTSILYRERCQ